MNKTLLCIAAFMLTACSSQETPTTKLYPELSAAINAHEEKREAELMSLYNAQTSLVRAYLAGDKTAEDAAVQSINKILNTK